MKKALLTFVLGVVVAAFGGSTAFAWTYTVSGSGACQPDGKYKITWTINNPENEDLTVKESDRASVPVGSTVAKMSSQNFTEMVDGTQAATYHLNVNVTWPSDMNDHKMSAKTTLDQPCKQPTQGKGSTTSVKPTVAPKVVPVGAVPAGEGGAGRTINAAALVAFITSSAAIVLGVSRRYAYKS